MSSGGYQGEGACGEHDRRQIVRWLGGFLQGCRSIPSEDRRMLRFPHQGNSTMLHCPL
jgi:hypothetical protein